MRVKGTVRTVPTGFRAPSTYNRRRIAVVKEVQTNIGAYTWVGNTVAVPFLDYYTFDPSGVIGNSNFPSLAAAVGAPDWNEFSALYKFYKVDKITLILRLVQSAGQVANLFNYAARCRWRHDYDFTGAAATSALWTEDYENVKTATFTPEAPQVKITLYPRVQTPQYNFVSATGSFIQQGMTPQKMKWTDTSQPATLYGLRFMWEYFPSTFNCVVDVQFHLRFKSRK